MLKKSLKHKFNSSFRWNIFGSFFYASIKIINQVFLLKIMSFDNYGLMSTTFSFIYFIMYLSELGATQAIPTFLNIFMKSKANFKYYFIKLYFIPQLIIYSIASIVGYIYYRNSFFYIGNRSICLIIIIIILFEGIRSLLRRLLHNIFATKETVLVESILMVLFISLIWVPSIFFKKAITLSYIFITFLSISILSVILLMTILIKYYRSLPNENRSSENNFLFRMIKTRFFAYTTISISKNFFSGNFLTPFFANNFGLQSAGIFNIASHIAESIKAITKSITMFSGGGLFAKLKSSTIKVKKEGFQIISRSLNNIIYPILIFILINNKFIFRLNKYPTISSTTAMILLFFIIISMELLFMAYEQFYTLEEKIEKLFIFKLFEMLMFYIIVSSHLLYSPVIVLLSLLIVKIISFILLSINAYTLWHIKPILKIKLNIAMISILLSIIFRLLIN